MILFGEASHGQELTEYIAHYHAERNHQGVDSQLLEPPDTSSVANEVIYRREWLGGLLNYYYREVARKWTILLLHQTAGFYGWREWRIWFGLLFEKITGSDFERTQCEP